MRKKRAHRNVVCEILESRRLLSGIPSIQINYLDVYEGSKSEETAGSNGNTIYTYANVPLHVTGVPSNESDGTPLTGTDLNDTTDTDNAAIKAEWQWDFGDPGSEYDTLDGFNAAHIYTTPGTYPLTLTVTNEDGFQGHETINVSVSIEPFDDTTSPSFGGIFYVAETSIGTGLGNDSTDAMDLATLQNDLNNGPGSTPIPSDSQILFKNGDEFDITDSIGTLQITQQNIMISTWHSIDENDPMPTFVNQQTAGNPEILKLTSSSLNVVISNIAFTSPDNGVYVFDPEGNNFAVHSCAFTDFSDESYFVNVQSPESVPVGILVQNNTINDVDVKALAYFFFAQIGSDFTILGNTIIADTGSGDGVLRITDDYDTGRPLVQRVLIADNNLTDNADANDGDGKTIRLVVGSYIDVSGNTLSSGNVTVWLGASQEQTTPGDILQDVICEQNVVYGAYEFRSGATDISLRNNIVTIVQGNEDNGQGTFTIDGLSDDLTDSDIFILSNTIIADSSVSPESDGFRHEILLRLNGTADAITFEDNLYYADPIGLSSGDYNISGGYGYILYLPYENSSLSSFTMIAGNIYADIPAAGNDPDVKILLGSDQVDGMDWDNVNTNKIQNDTFANVALNSFYIPQSNTGMASPVDGVTDDLYGKPRPASDWTVGAVEPDLDIASLGNVYLQTVDETVDGTAVPYVQVWNSQTAISTSNSPWLSLPRADFEGINIIGLVGGSDNITLDLSTDDMITGDLFYLAQGGYSTLTISPNVTTNLSVEVGDAATLDISSLSDGSATAPVMLVLSSLTIGAGADAQLACGQFSILSLDSLNVVTSGSYGTLDLTNETMVLNPSSSDDSTTQEALAAAYDTGKWDESGITSSLAESYPREGMGLGYIFSDVSVGTGVSETSAWEAAYGITLGSYGIVVRFTFYGDTNLDGVVNGTDTTNYSTSGPTDWFHGNFNYDSYHNADDFSLLELGAAEQDAGNITGGPAFDAEDVTAFADALAAGSESAFNSEYSGLGWNYANADINGDGVVNSEDIAGFDQIATDNGLAGFLNPTFGDNGMVTISGTYASFFAETTDANGNILATGTEDNHLIVARFFSNGTLDTSFGTDGFTTIDASTWDLGYAILALPNGNILVGGRGQVSGDVNSLLAMLNPDGSVDTSFGDDGSEIVDISAGYNVILGLSLQPDGKFLACTYAYDGTYSDVGLTRFNSDGTLDTSFGTDGTTLTSFDWWDGGSDVAVLSDGSILVSGNADGNMAVIKYNSDGTFDDSFGTDGVASFGVTGEARDMLVLSSGQILIAGQTDNNFVIGLLNSDGSIDTSFGTGGMVETDLGTSSCICGLIVQSNGQIVVSGYAGDDIVLARYNSDGSLDTSFGSGGMTQTDVDYALSDGMQQMLMQQGNGNYVVAAGTNGEMILAEYNG